MNFEETGKLSSGYRDIAPENIAKHERILKSLDTLSENVNRLHHFVDEIVEGPRTSVGNEQPEIAPMSSVYAHVIVETPPTINQQSDRIMEAIEKLRKALY